MSLQFGEFLDILKQYTTFFLLKDRQKYSNRNTHVLICYLINTMLSPQARVNLLFFSSFPTIPQSFNLVFESFIDYVAVEQLDGDNKYDAGEHGLQVFFFFKSHFKFYFYVLILPYKAMVAKKHCKTHFRLYQLIWVIFFSLDKLLLSS